MESEGGGDDDELVEEGWGEHGEEECDYVDEEQDWDSSEEEEWLLVEGGGQRRRGAGVGVERGASLEASCESVQENHSNAAGNPQKCRRGEDVFVRARPGQSEGLGGKGGREDGAGSGARCKRDREIERVEPSRKPSRLEDGWKGGGRGERGGGAGGRGGKEGRAGDAARGARPSDVIEIEDSD